MAKKTAVRRKSASKASAAKRAPEKTVLYDFYGRECPHCIRMEPLMKQAERELGVEFTRFEVWHDGGNARMMEEYDRERCNGVPFFFHPGTKKFVCGEVDYPVFKKWAAGK